MPAKKRSAAEAFLYYSELLLVLVPEAKKEAAEKILNEWKDEAVPLKKPGKAEEKKRLKKEDFRKKMEEYLLVEPVAEFRVSEDNFENIEKCKDLIVKLHKQDSSHNRTLLQSAAWQGKALKKILDLCGNKKKLFMEKIEVFEIPYTISYSYFLIRLSTLVFSHQLLFSSAVPVSFIRKHFKEIEDYLGYLNQTALQNPTFGSQDMECSWVVLTVLVIYFTYWK